jgi:hypothetical protein
VNSSGYNFLVVATRLDKSNVGSFKKLSELYYKAKELGYGFICATSTSQDEVNNFALEHSIPFQFVIADEVTLKTIVRSNPGLLLIYNGTIIGKWHWRNLPDSYSIDENMLSKQLLNIKKVSNNELSIAFAVVLLLLVIIVKYWRK